MTLSAAAFDSFEQDMKFDEALSVGDRVRVNWTNGGRAYSSVGSIAKVNTSSVAVTIDADTGPYKKGHKITVPRILNVKKWSHKNRVEPID